MADIFSQYNVATGAGTGTQPDPYGIITAATTAAAGDVIKHMFDPTDREGTITNLAIGEQIVFGNNFVACVPADLSGAHTNVMPIIDGALSALNIFRITKVVALIGFELRNAGVDAIAFSSLGDNTILSDIIIRDATGDGVDVITGANNVKLSNVRAYDCGGRGINVSGTEAFAEKVYAEGNTGIQINFLSFNGALTQPISLEDGSSSAIVFEAQYGLLSFPTVIHTGGASGGCGVEMDTSAYMVCKGLIAVSEGATTSRFTYPAAIHATATSSASMEGSLSYNNQNADAQNSGSAKNYSMVTATDPDLVGGTPFDATPQGDLSGILRTEAIGEESVWLLPGAIQASVASGGGAIGNRTIRNGGAL